MKKDHPFLKEDHVPYRFMSSIVVRLFCCRLAAKYKMIYRFKTTKMIVCRYTKNEFSLAK